MVQNKGRGLLVCRSLICFTASSFRRMAPNPLFSTWWKPGWHTMPYQELLTHCIYQRNIIHQFRHKQTVRFLLAVSRRRRKGIPGQTQHSPGGDLTNSRHNNVKVLRQINFKNHSRDLCFKFSDLCVDVSRQDHASEGIVLIWAESNTLFPRFHR